MGLMDFGEMGVSDAQDFHAVAGGEEYRLRCTNVKEGKSSSDKNPDRAFYLVFFEIADDALAKEISYFLWKDMSGLDEKQLNSAQLNWRDLLNAFEMDLDGSFDPEEAFPGCEAWAILSLKDDETYGPQNNVKSFVTGK